MDYEQVLLSALEKDGAIADTWDFIAGMPPNVLGYFHVGECHAIDLPLACHNDHFHGINKLWDPKLDQKQLCG